MIKKNHTSGEHSFVDTVMSAFKSLFISKQSVIVQTAKISDMLSEIARLDPDATLSKMGTNPDGLSAEEAEKRLEIYGPNQVASEDHKSVAEQILRLLINPLNIMLLVLAIVNFVFLDDIESGSLVSLMVILSVGLSFVQENRSNNAAEKLRAMVSTTASVLRRAASDQEQSGTASQDSRKSSRLEVPITELVPGDIIWLSAGDIIPGDVRILSARDLFINQSALTGQSMPTEKFPSLIIGWKPLSSLCQLLLA
jgi:Mg2+-importing ATPase